jgi:hypothetical protein
MHRTPSFRCQTGRISLAALFLVYPLAATAVAQSLPGWGPYNFGTPRSKVVAGEGRVLLPGKGGPELLDSATIDGQLYTVGLYFRGASDPKLWKIQLHAELGKVDRSGCRDFFVKIAGDLKEKYGEMEGNASKAPLAQAAAYGKKFGDGSTLRILETFVGGCDVNVTYEAPPLQPIEGLGF